MRIKWVNKHEVLVKGSKSDNYHLYDNKRCYETVEEKLINQSKNEMENFIQEEFENSNLGTASQKAWKTVPPIRSQSTVIGIFWNRGLYNKWCIIDSLHNPDLSVLSL